MSFTYLYFVLALVLSAGDAHGQRKGRDELYRLKAQGEFYKDFSRLNVERWLNTKTWKKSLKHTKAQKEQEIERDYLEEIGRVISCVGRCQIIRKHSMHDLSYRSLIIEGDTIETAKDSYLYIALKDGNIMRLSSLTKLQLPEINLAHNRSLLVMVLVHGFVHQIERSIDPLFLNEELVDTDPIIFPLRYQPANMEMYFWRKRATKKNTLGTRQQLFDHYRGLKSLADQFTTGKLDKEYLVNTPHGDFYVKNSSFMIDLGFNRGVSWKHGDKKIQTGQASMQLRKAVMLEEKLVSGQWYSIDRGDIRENNELKITYSNEEFLTQRGIGVRIVRDHFVNKYFDKSLEAIVKNNKMLLAKEGSKLWSAQEFSQRFNYIKGYYHFMARRWIKHQKKYNVQGAQVKPSDYNKKAVLSYINILKNQSLRDNKLFNRLNPTQFHFWLHAKSQGHWYPKRFVDAYLKREL